MVYPAVVTAAVFFAIIIEDSIARKSKNIVNHIFLGIISIILMTYLSMNGANIVAWGILILPMLIILFSYIFPFYNKAEKSTVTFSKPPPQNFPVPSNDLSNLINSNPSNKCSGSNKCYTVSNISSVEIKKSKPITQTIQPPIINKPQNPVNNLIKNPIVPNDVNSSKYSMITPSTPVCT